MKSELLTLKIADWTIRYRQPVGEGSHPVIWLFHGWMGDEDSMWVFESLLPENFLILAPRGLFPQDDIGYGWYPHDGNKWPRIETLTPVVNGIKDLEENWPLFAPWADFSNLRLAGFSQGAAVAYAYTILHPEDVQAVAGLAGFLPVGISLQAEVLSNCFDGIKVYISHGVKDQIVPVDKGTEAARFFESKGAEVTFCESDVGHKLSVDCFKGLEVFFE